MNQGGTSLGEPVLSFLSRSLKYAFDHSLAGLAAFLLGSVRVCERNLRFPRILMQLRPGMAGPYHLRATSSLRDPASGPSSATRAAPPSQCPPVPRAP